MIVGVMVACYRTHGVRTSLQMEQLTLVELRGCNLTSVHTISRPPTQSVAIACYVVKLSRFCLL